MVRLESVEDLARCLDLHTPVEVRDPAGLPPGTVATGVIARFALNWAPVVDGRFWPRHRYRFSIADPAD